MEVPLLNDILVIFSLSIVVMFICLQLRVPVIVGFLLTGILAGPYGFKLIDSIHEVNVLAEVGVALLLFTIGMEFSLRKLLQIKKLVLVGGALQVSLTILAFYGIARLVGRPPNESLFWGFLVSLSSTAIVLKLLQEKAETDSPHGRTILGILIFQDIIVVPMVLITPLLAGKAHGSDESILFLLGQGIGIVMLAIVAAKWIVPQVLYQIARTKNREIFLLTIVVICLTAAWLTQAAGLSLALGAFLAGLIISESEYNLQALGSVLPFRDVFTSLFFVSMGMLLDVAFFFSYPLFTLIIVIGILFIKGAAAALGCVLLGMPLRTAILVGLSLGQVGEFSFILSKAATEHGLLGGDSYQMFLACSILSMAMAPFVIVSAPGLSGIILRLPMTRRLREGAAPVAQAKKTVEQDHLIIVGCGVNGRNVARSAKLAGIPYVMLDMNPETVRLQRDRGEPIHYGDATREAVLEHANIKEARIAVVAINDPTATRGIVGTARRLNPKIHLIVRTQYLQEMKPLHKLGADEIIPEEFETSVEIFSRVLARYLIPRDEIERIVIDIRSEGYEMFRKLSGEASSSFALGIDLPDVEVSTLRIPPGSPFEGKTLRELDLRKSYGLTVLAISRDSKITSNPDGDMELSLNDILYALGHPSKISEVANLLRKTG